jgi:hypothetical protein
MDIPTTPVSRPNFREPRSQGIGLLGKLFRIALLQLRQAS